MDDFMWYKCGNCKFRDDWTDVCSEPNSPKRGCAVKASDEACGEWEEIDV